MLENSLVKKAKYIEAINNTKTSTLPSKPASCFATVQRRAQVEILRNSIGPRNGEPRKERRTQPRRMNSSRPEDFLDLQVCD